MKKTGGTRSVFEKFSQSAIVSAVRIGLVNMIPILIIGAFALILKTFPLTAYQKFLTTTVGGYLLSLFDFVYAATFGVLSVYMTFSISRAFVDIKANPNTVTYGPVFASVLSFFIMSGANLKSFGSESMGPKSMFLAIITGLGASALYLFFERVLGSHKHVLFTSGADRNFNRMITTLLPITLVAIVFAVINLLIVRVFGAESVRELLSNLFNKLFSFGGTGFFKGLFFVLLSSVLWFFGIHGSDTLEGVMQTYFVPGLEANQAAVAAGSEPTQILTKQFFDCFVLMGGCGSAICLLIAILLFSRNRARRGLGYAAAFPMIFNINELMVFGLPIIFNPIMLIPFLLVPLVCYSVAYIAMLTGIVPMITGAVEWTTPIILGGYHATGSVAGSLLQVFNVIIGVLIYVPFVRILDKQSLKQSEKNYVSFMDYFKQNENLLTGTRIMDLDNMYGDFAKTLCAEIRHGIKSGVVLAYQPQYNYKGECVGAEALMRFKHPAHGILYPPVIFKLAEEGGFLTELEQKVLSKAVDDLPEVRARFGDNIKVSVNITGSTVTKPQFLQFCQNLDKTVHFSENNMCIEVTEQTALALDEGGLSALKELKGMGFTLAIDDFSMGQTSLHYMKDGLFDIVKLDGSLITGILEHASYKEIVASITGLASSLNMTVLAEYVETEEQRETLHGIGCDCYQGYLYSKAVFLDE